MKKLCFCLIFSMILGLCACASLTENAPIMATTKPVYDFTSALCQGTGLEVGLLIDENISCLHDYSLSTAQVRSIENAQVVVISGAGLEVFPDQVLAGCRQLIDASQNIILLECDGHNHEGHQHEQDAHIWLAPENAKIMAHNICAGLIRQYPAQEAQLQSNLAQLLQKLDALQCYGESALQNLSCREIITFHDGFAYLAGAFGLTILEAVEEESGSEASAKELIQLIKLVKQQNLPAVFTEINGSTSAAGIIGAETGAAVHALDMGMGQRDYFEMMYHNIDTLKEALE